MSLLRMESRTVVKYEQIVILSLLIVILVGLTK
jgi:hypothetical protein